MYKCTRCDEIFEEPARKRISFETYYGVDDLFINEHRMDLLICPHCKYEEMEELQVCDICNEWFPEDELIDTEGLTNGSCGYCCKQCCEDCDIIV